MSELRNQVEYEEAIAQIERLQETEPVKGTASFDELQRLYAMVAAFEREKVRPHDVDDLPVADPEDEEE